MATSFTAQETGAKYGGVLYLADDAAAPNWAAYYLPKAALTGPAPPSLTLESSWSDYWGVPIKRISGGCYAFFAEHPPSSGSADALDVLLGTLNGQYVGRAYRWLVWIPLPATGQPLSAPAAIPFAQGGSGSGGSVVQAATVALRTLQLRVPTGIALGLGDDGASIVASAAGTARMSLSETRGPPTPVGTITSSATIGLGLAGAGVIATTLDLSAGPGQTGNDFLTLAVGVSYSYAVDGIVKTQLFPILGPPRQPLEFQSAVTLDPLNATDATRTKFTFKSGSPLSTSLRTTTGIPLTLDPVPGDGGLALAPEKVTPLAGPPQIDSYHATPCGAYEIGAGAPAPAGALPLLCGTSGLEAVSVTPAGGGYDGDRLVFTPGKPAFAPTFPPDAVSLNDPGAAGLDKPRLADQMTAPDGTVEPITTAWASVQPANGTTPKYYAQPHGAPLFGGGSSTLGTLPLVELSASDATAAFPLAAYAGVQPGPVPDAFDPTLLPAFEQAVLSPARRARLTGGGAKMAARLGPAAVADDPGPPATTPQGFLVHLGTGSSWASLLLAQITDAEGSSTLEFTPVDPRVQAAFQTNQLSLVATKTAWGDDTFENAIAIEGWPFTVAVGEDQSFGSYSNVMIAKFCHGTLEDLIADPKRWTDAGDFNVSANNGLVAVSDWLQAYLTEAANSPDPAFAHFNSIAKDETWQGILILRVTVPLNDLPPQVGALRAGLPGSPFYAHHLGIEVTKVDESLSVSGSSSLFGLIDYVDPVYAQALANGADPNTPIPSQPGLTYDFKVLRLLVVFTNSQVQTFQSKSQVTLNQWFGDGVLKTVLGEGGSVTNSIVIDGALQRHDGQPVYTFTSTVDTKFELDSNVLSAVEVASTSLVTISDSTTGPSQFRFAFSGKLVFAALPGLDAFSFDGLAFSNLYLELAYDPQAAVPRTFAFDASRIAFNVGGSAPRQTSMFAAFPLTLKGLVVGRSGGPSQLGYLNVSLPGVKLASLPDQWYGLQYDLDLGGPGALAADVGWTAGLLVAWGAGSKASAPSASAAAGLHLPGAGGRSKLLSLQGVLKLTIGQIELTYTSGSAYLLKLKQIALHFLVFQFPPSGETDFYLFGNPGAQPGQRSAIAWYAAYVNPQKQLTA